MEVERWPSFLLRLLGRVLRKGGKVLEHQGRTLTRVAEEWADDRRSDAKADDQSASTDESVHRSPSSSDAPPEHWLKMIRKNDGDLHWIDHTEENALANPPQKPVQSPPSSGQTPSGATPGNQTDSPFSSPYRTEAESPGSSAPEEEPTNESSRRDFSEGATLSDSAAETEAVDPQRSGHRQQEGVEEEESEAAADSPSSASSRQRRRSRERSSSGPMRLRPSSTKDSVQKGQTDPDEESVDHSIGRTSETPSTPSPEARYSSSNAREKDSGATEETDPPFSAVSSKFPSEASENPSGFERKGSVPSHSSENVPKDRPGAFDEQIGFRTSRGAQSTSSSQEERGQRQGEESDRFPRSVDRVETTDRGDSTRTFQHQMGNTSANPAWPTLPDVGEILEEEVSDPYGWKRDVREWQRRRRLNREQRGELWSE